MFPALRLGFVVAPAWAQSALSAAKRNADGQCSPLTQETLAAFISEGHLARHVRRMRQVYGGRRQVLLAGLQQHLSSWLIPVPSAAGLHLAALTPRSVDVESVITKAWQRHIGVYSLHRFQIGKPARPGLVFGYGTLSEREIAEGLRSLRSVFGGR
jgi:GntR family transcriptional regulator / MocR family aminotransferase